MILNLLLNDMDGFYKNVAEYNPNKKCKMLSVFKHLIADKLSNKKCAFSLSCIKFTSHTSNKIFQN